ncbi:hypothetical protein SLEP1_g42698 [Rubroshorea leprosula]|uniref:DUF4219 domain-containing protein n=1 Tax=Rubroshorea leprosula TaxID=152421 RepID=A0AAV5LAQ4_9ROSI|nr:hypothetical protein SLEP1_g42698 [Rubroshorea leprosula]
MKANLVQPVPFPEVHKEDNYERWHIIMQHYLVAQDLWDVVLSSEMPDGEDPREWIKKNALALYAIKISCEAEKFDQIKDINSAKDAWNALADLHKQPNEDGNKDTGIKTVERKQAVTLLKDIEKGDSDAVKKLLETHSSYSARALENGSTALHVAITAGKIELAKELTSVMSEARELETQNETGKTVLHLAACMGSREIAECLVRKNKKLLEIPDCEKRIPLVLACATCHKSLTLYLYSVTPIEILDPVNGDREFFLLMECLRNRMFDLTFHKSSLEPTPIISELVQILSSLFAGIWFRRLPFWEWPLYIVLCKVPIIEDLLVGDKWKTLLKKPEVNPDIVWSYDSEHSRDMLMYAVAHRQEEIAKFLYGLNA